ncbi:MAG: NADP-dependent isocitrate dehydrogenase [Pseudomonadota bacterium]|nr:NADP-dependent isocitrate dehydrogenase [Pseudomonadota bacterium]
MAEIIYTTVDEAPELASASLLPIIRKFASAAGLQIEKRDISLAGRIIAMFPEILTDAHRHGDDLLALGNLVKTPQANVIKLPNISASVPQLKAAISELQSQGYALPDYPDTPQNDKDRSVRDRYDAVKGSAVNPVLREGNSDRRAARAVKNYAKQNPHKMGVWQKDSATHVVSMPADDFVSNEKSSIVSDEQAGLFKIVFENHQGQQTVLKDGLDITAGTVVDSAFMHVATLRRFIAEQLADAKAKDILFSVHLKATMMKVADPIVFGQVVSVLLQDFITKHKKVLDSLGFNPNLGLSDLEQRIASLATDQRSELESDLATTLADQPRLYMVDADRGISNLHVSSDVIIDASMPALIRAGGRAWGPDGQEADCKCVIPDNSYAPIYDESINFFKANGALDPTSCGAVSNVGLMAQKAEEYGSHPTTFEMFEAGIMRVIAGNGDLLHEHQVGVGDIWRMSTTKRAPIVDWVRLGLARQKATGADAVFWLDADRAHDAQLLRYIKRILAEDQADCSNIHIMTPRQATNFTLKTITAGKDCISITGNVLRDYLTDLFPILELGTSAKMLSIVKLMNGGGLFETGAGGSAPKHVQQLVEEGHLRWDSLGEFCALGESLIFTSELLQNRKSAILGRAVDAATQDILAHDKSPRRGVGETDTRDSHFYFALYWARAVAAQTDDTEMAKTFAAMATEIESHERKIVEELASTQGCPCDLGGYYKPNPNLVAKIMRPSATFNRIIG